MTYEEFRKLVREMMQAQRKFFDGDRSVECLENAKRLEKQVRDELKRQPGEQSLFSD